MLIYQRFKRFQIGEIKILLGGNDNLSSILSLFKNGEKNKRNEENIFYRSISYINTEDPEMG